MNVYLKQYQKNEVETASPEKILILLYDGAINFLNKAKVAMEEGNIEQTHNNILACEKIILEFMNTLDMDQGKELAENLYRLYEYLYNTLVEANLKRDRKKLMEVLNHLKELRITWQRAITISNAEKQKNVTSTLNDGKSYYDDGNDDDDDDDDEFKDSYERDDDD